MAGLVAVLVGFGGMARMVVLVGAVFARMHVVVGLRIRAVFVGVLVLVHVPVVMGVGVRMGMLPDPGMFVFVGVFVGVLVDVLVAVFVISLHRRSSVISILGSRPARRPAWWLRPCRFRQTADAAWSFRPAASGCSRSLKQQ
ncbi:MAG: hypothetical protein GYA47_01350 [Desulfovibrio sp.]|nr:hypothetical protein [Desulfovibrio sp.]